MWRRNTFFTNIVPISDLLERQPLLLLPYCCVIELICDPTHLLHFKVQQSPAASDSWHVLRYFTFSQNIFRSLNLYVDTLCKYYNITLNILHSLYTRQTCIRLGAGNIRVYQLNTIESCVGAILQINIKEINVVLKFCRKIMMFCALFCFGFFYYYYYFRCILKNAFSNNTYFQNAQGTFNRKEN